LKINSEMEHNASANNKAKVMQSQPIHIKRGILQGESLSPLLFCTAFSPATCKYQVHGAEKKVSHLLYVDATQK
jgi:hypothetical protein